VVVVKGIILVLLFTGELEYRSFDYEPEGSTNEEIVIACSERAEEVRDEIAVHSWDDPRGHGWYLEDGSGTIQGHIC
jgi:hypothetical protein